MKAIFKNDKTEGRIVSNRSEHDKDSLYTSIALLAHQQVARSAATVFLQSRDA